MNGHPLACGNGPIDIVSLFNHWATSILIWGHPLEHPPMIHRKEGIMDNALCPEAKEGTLAASCSSWRSF